MLYLRWFYQVRSVLDQPLVWAGNILWPMPSPILNLKLALKVTQENKDRGTCCNSVTVCPDVNFTTRPDTVLLTKCVIVKNKKIFKLWIHIHLTFRHTVSRE